MNVKFLCWFIETAEIPDYNQRSFWVVTWHQLAVSYNKVNSSFNKYCSAALPMFSAVIFSISDIQGDSGGICNTLGNDSMCDSKQKSSYEHGSDFERLRSYDRLKLRREGNDY
jgi:hypothetical protein